MYRRASAAQNTDSTPPPLSSLLVTNPGDCLVKPTFLWFSQHQAGTALSNIKVLAGEFPQETCSDSTLQVLKWSKM